MLNVSCNSHCFLALCCALHRITSRVIHRTELFVLFCICTFDSYSMTNNNDLLNMEKLSNKTSHTREKTCMFELKSCSIRNGATQLVRRLGPVARSESNVHDRIEAIQSETVMIHTQVHLRIPCYDFYFL